MFSRVVEYFTTGGEPPNLKDSTVLVVNKLTGQATWYSGNMDALDVDYPVAAGSGYELALGAMVSGQTAYAAILAAAEYDAGTKVDHGITSIPIGESIE